MNKTILITNDDGIDSEGIKILAEAAKRFGEVYVVAPRHQMSAVSHSITLRDPIKVYKYDFEIPGVMAYAAHGTPADCIRVGSLNVLPHKPDIVLSGINFGYNAGTDVQYSATVGAAMEAAFQGINAIAFSEGIDSGYDVAKKYLKDILEKYIDIKLDSRTILNVNFPNCRALDVKGILTDRICSANSVYWDTYDGIQNPDGSTDYMVVGHPNSEYEQNSDLLALRQRYISVGTLRNIS